MQTIIDLPFQEKIDNSSGTKAEGFATNIIRYGSKVTQTSFQGASIEASREEEFSVKWAFIEYATPEEVVSGKVDELEQLREFYKQSQSGFVRYRPFEVLQSKIWRVKPNSLKVKNIAGCIFKAELVLEFLYNE